MCSENSQSGAFAPRGHLAVWGHVWLTLLHKAAIGIQWEEARGAVSILQLL